MLASRTTGYRSLIILSAVAACAGPDLGAPRPEPRDESPSQQPKVASSDVEASALKNLVAEVRISDETSVRYYEPEPGVLIEYQHGRLQDQAFAEDTAGMTAIESYEALTGEAAPPALRQAQQRVDRAGVGQGEGATSFRAPARAPAASREKGGPVPRQWFLDTFCVATDRNRLWTWGSGPSWFYDSGVNYFAAGAYANSGEVIYYYKYKPIFGTDYFINTWLPVGYFAGLKAWSDTNAGVRSEVSQADGDIYDHCINWHY
jgi:hypothetical protein